MKKNGIMLSQLIIKGNSFSLTAFREKYRNNTLTEAGTPCGRIRRGKVSIPGSERRKDR